jgi:hypothetical protein
MGPAIIPSFDCSHTDMLHHPLVAGAVFIGLCCAVKPIERFLRLIIDPQHAV